MLTRIIRLDHVGLFHTGAPAVVDLRRATLIYGENGRGKSTLSAVLDSCARNRPGLITCRSTIDVAPATPAVDLIFDTGTPRVTFENGAWSSPRPEICVFDSGFVRENVYTGLAITSENRRGLYEFALGDAARDIEEMDRLVTAQATAGRTRGERVRALIPLVQPFTTEQFIVLAEEPDIEARLADARQRLVASQRAAEVLLRQDLVPLRDPGMNLDGAFEVLRRSLVGVNGRAEERVREHLAHHQQQGFQDWVSRGRTFARPNECPYCGQDTQAVDLIAAYGEVFSEEYGRLQDAIDEVAADLAGLVNPVILWDRWNDGINANSARQDAWGDLVPIERIAFDLAAATEDVRQLAGILREAIGRKSKSLADPINFDEEHATARAVLTRIETRIVQYNERVAAANAQYAVRKAEIAAGNPAELAQEVARMEARRRRYTPGVVAAINAYQQIDADWRAVTAEKEAVKERHDARMREVLAAYEGAINRKLDALRTGFHIERLAGRHDGGQKPRTTFAIAIRGRTITELEHSDNTHSLPTALSDGDRRSLALAFFLARLELDPQLANRILVFDDPMASFDEYRKRETVKALCDLVGRCRQVIVLSHDAHFLRDVRGALERVGVAHICHKIGYAAQEYAQLDDCNLDELCSSEYFTRYKAVWDYLNGQNGNGARQVAEDLRVLVEEYYKLRYPHHLAPTLTLSGIIAAIREAHAGTPLATLQPLLPHLEDFNEYTSRYHHGNPNARNEPIQERTVQHYARGALSLIQDDGRSSPIVP